MESLLSPILLAIHIMLAAALIGVVLLQRSEGGIGGLGGGGMSGFMSGRGSANLLTRTTRWLAGAFMATSLVLAWLATQSHVPEPLATQQSAPNESPSVPTQDPTSGETAPPAASDSTAGTGGTSPPVPTAPTVPTTQ